MENSSAITAEKQSKKRCSASKVQNSSAPGNSKETIPRKRRSYIKKTPRKRVADVALIQSDTENTCKTKPKSRKESDQLYTPNSSSVKVLPSKKPEDGDAVETQPHVNIAASLNLNEVANGNLHDNSALVDTKVRNANETIPRKRRSYIKKTPRKRVADVALIQSDTENACKTKPKSRKKSEVKLYTPNSSSVKVLPSKKPEDGDAVEIPPHVNIAASLNLNEVSNGNLHDNFASVDTKVRSTSPLQAAATEGVNASAINNKLEGHQKQQQNIEQEVQTPNQPNKHLGIDSPSDVVIKQHEEQLTLASLQPNSVVDNQTEATIAFEADNTSAFIVGNSVESRMEDSIASVSQQLKQKSLAASASGARKQAENIITLPEGIACKPQQFNEAIQSVCTAESSSSPRRPDFSSPKTAAIQQQPSQKSSKWDVVESNTKRRNRSCSSGNRRRKSQQQCLEQHKQLPTTTDQRSFAGNISTGTVGNQCLGSTECHGFSPLIELNSQESSVAEQESVHSIIINEEQLMQPQPEDQIDGPSTIVAIPTQPIPGYDDTFLLCRLVDNIYKPIDNIPLYLDNGLNQLVPVPLEAMDGPPNLIVNHPPVEEIVDELQSSALVQQANDDVNVASQAQLIHLQPQVLGSTTPLTAEETAHGAATEDVAATEDAAADRKETKITVYLPPTCGSDLQQDSSLILNIEGQEILIDAATLSYLFANPDANIPLTTDHGTEVVLPRDIVAALEAQQDTQEQSSVGQQRQMEQVQQIGEAGLTDILAVALEGNDLHCREVETSPGLQLVGADDIVYRQTTLPRGYLTTATSETNVLLNQRPLMSTFEKPSTAVTAQSSSSVPTSLELPITVTNPAIAPKSTMAGPTAAIGLPYTSSVVVTEEVPFHGLPHRTGLTPGETRIYTDPGSSYCPSSVNVDDEDDDAEEVR